MDVLETISHGGYRTQRVVTLDPESPAMIADIVRTCPYVAEPESLPLRAVGMALASGGSYAHGWVTWEAVR